MKTVFLLVAYFCATSGLACCLNYVLPNLKDLANLFEQKIAVLQQQNNSITPTYLQEVNEKIVSNLRYTITPTNPVQPSEISVLASIAAQCPYTGGATVIDARTMLARFGYDRLYRDPVTCANQGVS